MRNRPQRSPIHRHTVDRHLVETVARAGRDKRARRARRTTLLLAALLHDIGKRPGAGDHSIEGAALVRADRRADGLRRAGRRRRRAPGRRPPDARRARHDRATPTTRRPCARLLDAVDHRPDLLELLRALTEADAVAAGPDGVDAVARARSSTTSTARARAGRWQVP